MVEKRKHRGRKNKNKFRFFSFIRIIQLVVLILFIIGLYMIIPYVLEIAGVESFVVITNSMEHTKVDKALYESFWDKWGVDASDLPHKRGIYIGDLVIIDTSPKEYNVGDVLLIKKPGETNVRVHRMFAYNKTHFRDIADASLTLDRNETVWLVAKGHNIIETSDPDSVTNADRVYQGKDYETLTHNWMPVSYLRGKVITVLPKAGCLHLFLYPFDLEKIQGVRKEGGLII